YDPDHSEDEDRFLTFGHSIAARLLVVSHTDRGDAIRIISVRTATRKERKIYEEGQ
ncbi:MAG: BrnT family toxin, partial [Planctomycetota bacterium]